jgi:hypothetical protein
MFCDPAEFPLKIVMDTSHGVENHLVTAVLSTLLYSSQQFCHKVATFILELILSLLDYSKKIESPKID